MRSGLTSVVRGTEGELGGLGMDRSILALDTQIPKNPVSHPLLARRGGTPTIIASGQPANGIAVDATSVYWTAEASGTVMKVSTGGGIPTTLASGQYRPTAIAVDATSVHWTNGADSNANNGTVMKAPLDGGTLTTLASGQNGPTAIAVDATSVYWTDTFAGTVMKVSTGGGTPTTLASEQDGPHGIAVDATSVYWANGDGTVMKVSIGGGTPTVLISLASPWYAYCIVVDSTSAYLGLTCPLAPGNIQGEVVKLTPK
jgi:sugar lactone lactonase YvrE